jgi:hypothetical protein
MLQSRVGSHKHSTGLERLAMDKNFSLLQALMSYGLQNLVTFGPVGSMASRNVLKLNIAKMPIYLQLQKKHRIEILGILEIS